MKWMSNGLILYYMFRIHLNIRLGSGNNYPIKRRGNKSRESPNPDFRISTNTPN